MDRGRPESLHKHNCMVRTEKHDGRTKSNRIHSSRISGVFSALTARRNRILFRLVVCIGWPGGERMSTNQGEGNKEMGTWFGNKVQTNLRSDQKGVDRPCTGYKSR